MNIIIERLLHIDACLENCTYSPCYSVYTSSGIFVVPCGVQQVRSLAVGGGSGGMNGDFGGGGSGYVRSGDFAVSPLQWIQVTVGTGGAGSSAVYGLVAADQNAQAGGTSSFGTYLSAAGGNGYTGSSFLSGIPGGSGGGEGCGCDPPLTGLSGNGGTDGSSGAFATPTTCPGWTPGTGQGPFTPYLQIFTLNLLKPGAGGKGNIVNPYGLNGLSGNWQPGGGGGGGILLNDAGPKGQAGTGLYSYGFGGFGYGGGGGAGGVYWHAGDSSVRYAGGRGADGIVYVEW